MWARIGDAYKIVLEGQGRFCFQSPHGNMEHVKRFYILSLFYFTFPKKIEFLWHGKM